MLACVVDATKEIKLMAGDEILCNITKMTEIERAIQLFHVRDDVSLDHLRHFHIDFDNARCTCNMMQKGQLSGNLAKPLPEPIGK